MKKTFVLGILFLLVMMSFTSISGNQINNQIVKPSIRGNIFYVGGSGEGNYTKIQDAIDDAVDGDTVFVYDDSSPYYESLVVGKSINLIAENRNTTIVTGNRCVDIKSDYVTVKGFKITSQSKDRSVEGIYVEGQNFCNILGNEIFGFIKGITVDNSQFINIFGNYIYNNEVGFALAHWNNIGINVSNNIITNNQWEGIQCYESHDLIVNNNTLTYNNRGIHSLYGNGHSYKFNNISYNTVGGVLSYSENVVIVGNIVSHNGGCGIDSNNGVLIYENIIFNNKGDGLSFSKDNSYIFENHIENNSGYGLISYSRESNIERNNLINNQINAFFINYGLFLDLLFKNKPDIWDSNYYSDTRSKSSYMIHGKVSFFFLILFPWYTIDENPAEEPYDIGV